MLLGKGEKTLQRVGLLSDYQVSLHRSIPFDVFKSIIKDITALKGRVYFVILSTLV